MAHDCALRAAGVDLVQGRLQDAKTLDFASIEPFFEQQDKICLGSNVRLPVLVVPQSPRLQVDDSVI